MSQNHEKCVLLNLILHTLYLMLYTDIDEPYKSQNHEKYDFILWPYLILNLASSWLGLISKY